MLAEFISESITPLVTTAGFAAGAVIDQFALKQSAEQIQHFNDIHAIATDEFIDRQDNENVKRHWAGKVAVKALMGLAGAATAFGAWNLFHGKTEVAPPRQTPVIIVDGTAQPLNDLNFSKLENFAKVAFSGNRHLTGEMADSNQTQVISKFNAANLSGFNNNLGGPDSILAKTTQNAIDAAGNSANEGPIVVLTDGISVGTPGEIKSDEQKHKQIPLDIVDTQGCKDNQLTQIAAGTGGQCWPMGSSGTIAAVKSVINPKIEGRSTPSRNIDWIWLSVMIGGLAAGGTTYGVRRQGILPHSHNVIGE